MTPQARIIVAEESSRIGVWTGLRQLPEVPAAEKLRALHWARRAISEAHARCQRGSSDAFSSWTAAVEGVWWVLALDEALELEMGSAKSAYHHARKADQFGKIVRGLRWLRHRHAHEIIVSGAGGPKRDFFAPPGSDHVLFISPSNRWKRSEEIQAEHDESSHLRPAYDEHVAGLPLELSLERCLIWFDRVFSACGFPDEEVPADRSEL